MNKQANYFKPYLKKALVLLMAVVMVFTYMPSMAFAGVGETTTTTVTVNFTAQAEGAFLIAPQFNVQVSSNLAESYGYEDQVTGGGGIST